MRHTESQIQRACVTYFRYQYPKLSRLLFHPKNEGHGSRISGAIAKAEGVVAGVPDLILAVPNSEHHMLCIEMKAPGGRQSKSQKEWQRIAEMVGAQYVIVKDLSAFVDIVGLYLSKVSLELIVTLNNNKI